jgi:hypothetical protein
LTAEDDWTRASRYSFHIWWSEESQSHYAQCKELRVIKSRGATPEEALHRAIDSVTIALGNSDEILEETLGDMTKTERPYSETAVAEKLGVSVLRVREVAQECEFGILRGPDRFFSAAEVLQIGHRQA